MFTGSGKFRMSPTRINFKFNVLKMRFTPHLTPHIAPNAAFWSKYKLPLYTHMASLHTHNVLRSPSHSLSHSLTPKSHLTHASFLMTGGFLSLSLPRRERILLSAFALSLWVSPQLAWVRNWLTAWITLSVSLVILQYLLVINLMSSLALPISLPQHST